MPPRSPRKPWLKWAARAALALGVTGVGAVGGVTGTRAHNQHVRTETARVREPIDSEARKAGTKAVEPVLEIPATIFRKVRRENPTAKEKEFDELVEKAFEKFRSDRATEADIVQRKNAQIDYYEDYFDMLVRATQDEAERLLKMTYRHPERKSDREAIEFYKKDVAAARKELTDYFNERAKRAEDAVYSAKSEYLQKEYAAIAKKAREIGWKVGKLSAAKALLAYLLLSASVAGTAAHIRRRRKQ